MKKKYTLGKIAIAAVMVLWIANAAITANKNNASVAAYTAGTGERYPNARISAEGTYGIVYLNKNAKEIILSDMAEQIGINRYEITSSREENVEISSLIQDGANGSVVCEIKTTETQASDLSIQAKQEFYICIDLTGHADAADEYAKILKEIFDKYEIKPEMSVSYYN